MVRVKALVVNTVAGLKGSGFHDLCTRYSMQCGQESVQGFMSYSVSDLFILGFCLRA